MSRNLPAHPGEERTLAIEPGLSQVLMKALPFAYGPIYQHVNMCPDDDPKDGPAPYEEVQSLHVNKLSNAVMESDWLKQYLRTALGGFIDWNVYNGAPGKGQAVYNEGGNPWLHEQIDSFVQEFTTPDED
jgi:hypothetical protein